MSDDDLINEEAASSLVRSGRRKMLKKPAQKYYDLCGNEIAAPSNPGPIIGVEFKMYRVERTFQFDTQILYLPKSAFQKGDKFEQLSRFTRYSNNYQVDGNNLVRRIENAADASVTAHMAGVALLPPVRRRGYITTEAQNLKAECLVLKIIPNSGIAKTLRGWENASASCPDVPFNKMTEEQYDLLLDMNSGKGDFTWEDQGVKHSEKKREGGFKTCDAFATVINSWVYIVYRIFLL